LREVGKNRLTLDPRLVTTEDNRLQELIRLIHLVLLLDRLDSILASLSDTSNKTIDSDLDPIPSLVSVHGVVSPTDGGDLAEADLLDVILEVLHVAGGGARGSVSPVSEEVDEDFGNADLLGSGEEGFEVVDVRVDSSVGDLSQRERR
jgi:hypothetical protein